MNRRLPLTAVALLLPCLSSGCALFHRRPPQPPAVVIFEPPILLPSLIAEPPMPPPDVFTPAGLLDARPEFALGMVGPRPPLPRRPNEVARSDEHPDAATPPPPAVPPQLSSLSPYQQENYRRAATQVINSAQHDLQLLYNRRNLDSQAVATRAQADEYVHQAQQALAQGDLVRAQTLAEKAATLARFLLNR